MCSADDEQLSYSSNCGSCKDTLLSFGVAQRPKHTRPLPIKPGYQYQIPLSPPWRPGSRPKGRDLTLDYWMPSDPTCASDNPNVLIGYCGRSPPLHFQGCATIYQLYTIVRGTYTHEEQGGRVTHETVQRPRFKDERGEHVGAVHMEVILPSGSRLGVIAAAGGLTGAIAGDQAVMRAFGDHCVLC